MRLKKVDSEYAIARINDWGYPHELGSCEIENCVFFSVKGSKGYVWFERLFRDEDLVIHLAFNPEKKGKVFSMLLWAEIIAIASKFGALRLCAVSVTKEIADYCLRLGFEPDPNIMNWYYFDLEDAQ